MGKKEKEPKPQEYRFILRWGDEQYRCSKADTVGFVHRNNNQYDHIYHQLPDKDGEPQGMWFWRDMFENFDSIIKAMDSNDFSIYEADTPSEQDADEYIRHVTRRKVADQAKEIANNQYISPRQQEQIDHLTDYILHLLQRGDFNENGDLTL